MKHNMESPSISLLTKNSYEICGKGHFMKWEHKLNIIQKSPSKLGKMNNLTSISLTWTLSQLLVISFKLSCIIQSFAKWARDASELAVRDVMKTIMQIEILDESPLKTSTLCWRHFPLWRLGLFIQVVLKHSSSCILPSF